MILLKRNMRTSFTTYNLHISEKFKTPKTRKPLGGQEMYSIHSKQCDELYIGQTNRKIPCRDEHKYSCSKTEADL